MTFTTSFELKSKGYVNLAITGTFTSIDEAIDSYLGACQVWADKTAGTVSIVDKKEKPAKAEQPKPTDISEKRRDKIHQEQANELVLRWCATAALVIPDFAGKGAFDVCQALKIDKPIAQQSVSELYNSVKEIRNAVVQYASNNEDASAYLEITALIDCANSLEELETNKKGFNRWKSLSPNAALFESAKALYEERVAVLSAAPLLQSGAV